jgi:tetrahydromethanopterin S-methyltransferase subunit G
MKNSVKEEDLHLHYLKAIDAKVDKIISDCPNRMEKKLGKDMAKWVLGLYVAVVVGGAALVFSDIKEIKTNIRSLHTEKIKKGSILSDLGNVI